MHNSCRRPPASDFFKKNGRSMTRRHAFQRIDYSCRQNPVLTGISRVPKVAERTQANVNSELNRHRDSSKTPKSSTSSNGRAAMLTQSPRSKKSVGWREWGHHPFHKCGRSLSIVDRVGSFKMRDSGNLQYLRRFTSLRSSHSYTRATNS